MLSSATEFPHPVSQAFLRPTAQPARIIQRNRDGTCLIAIDERFKKASSNRTVPLADLAATAEEAYPPALSRAVAANRRWKSCK